MVEPIGSYPPLENARRNHEDSPTSFVWEVRFALRKRHEGLLKTSQ